MSGSQTVEEAAKEALLMSNDVNALKEALAAGIISVKEYSEAIASLTAGQTAGVQAVKTLSSTMNSFNAAFAIGMNIIYKTVDQQVALYQATINAIAAQNTYTQGIALETEAKVIYGPTSEQATRATIAANYVGALYTQAKKNEAVASEQATTAIITSIFNLTEKLVNMIAPIQALVVAVSLWRAATIAATVAEGAGAAGLGAAGAADVLAEIIPTALVQGGAHIKQSGLAYVHGGETVVPAGSMGGGGTPNIEIHIHAASNVDLAKVRQEVQSAIAQALYRGQKNRGTY